MKAIKTIGHVSRLLLLVVFGCNTKTGPADQQANTLSYELVGVWPQPSQGYLIGQPSGIGIDNNDHLFVFHRAGREWTDPFPDSLISMNTILELDNETGQIINSWGANHFIMPHGLNLDFDNNVWVTDVALHQVFKFSHEGKLLMKLGVANVSGNDSLHFNRPTDVAVTSDGSIYVSDGYGNSRIVKFSPTGKYLLEWGTHGDKIGEFNTPHGITIDNKDIVYVADRENNRIQVFDNNGKLLKEIKNSQSALLLLSVTIDKKQNLYATDYQFATEPDTVEGSTIIRFDSSGNTLSQFGGTGTNNRIVSLFHDLSVDSKESIYLADVFAMKIIKLKVKSASNGR